MVRPKLAPGELLQGVPPKNIDSEEFAEFFLTKFTSTGNGSDREITELRSWVRTYFESVIPKYNLTNESIISQQAEDAVSYCNAHMVPDSYRQWHWQLSVLVASLGILANSLTILILTRKHMITATNAILLGIAIADFLVSFEYIPYAISQLFVNSSSRYSFSFAVYILIRAHFSQVFHTVAIWLTALLALWRWFCVCHPHEATSKCTLPAARKALTITYLACPILAGPTFLLYSVQEVNGGGVGAKYQVNFSPFVINNEIVWNVVFFLYSTVVKILPCIFLGVLIPCLIKGMWHAADRKKMLQGSTRNNNCRKNELATERTTRMLLVILLIFLLSEVPQGLLTGLTIFYGREFFRLCYLPLSDIMDLLALFNATVNFIVYCFMSQDFRRAFLALINCCHKLQPSNISATPSSATVATYVNTKLQAV